MTQTAWIWRYLDGVYGSRAALGYGRCNEVSYDLARGRNPMAPSGGASIARAIAPIEIEQRQQAALPA
jgi:hypothetical protein